MAGYSSTAKKIERAAAIAAGHPRVVLDVRTVPNYQAMAAKVLERKKFDAALEGAACSFPEEDEIKEFEKSLVSSEKERSGFIPIPYQKIVCATMLVEIPKRGGQNDSRLCSFTGDETFVIENVWRRLGALLPAPGADESKFKWPVVITGDRKKAHLPLLIHRSLSLYRTINGRLISACGQSLAEVSANGGEGQPEEQTKALAGRLAPIREGLRQMLSNADKWEDARPNYRGPYSLFQPDMIYDYDTQAETAQERAYVEAFAAAGMWDEIAEFSARQAVESYKWYLTGLEVCYGEPCTKSLELFTANSAKVGSMLTHKHLDPAYNPCIWAEVAKEILDRKKQRRAAMVAKTGREAEAAPAHGEETDGMQPAGEAPDTEQAGEFGEPVFTEAGL